MLLGDNNTVSFEGKAQLLFVRLGSHTRFGSGQHIDSARAQRENECV
jgi:hypothetical protein